jgi:hypothetical protein
MKYLKRFENIDKTFIGKYVLLNLKGKNILNAEAIEFLENTSGEIIAEYDKKITYEKIITVKYDNIPDNIKKFFSYSINNKFWVRNFYSSDIIFFSKNKDDIETFIQSKKYNL